MFLRQKFHISLLAIVFILASVVRAETANEKKFEQFRKAFIALSNMGNGSIAEDATFSTKKDRYTALTKEFNEWAISQGLYVSKHLEYYGPYFGELQRPQFTKITDAKDREKFRISIKGGKIYQADGKILGSGDAAVLGSDIQSKTNKYMFVMDALGRLYAAPEKEQLGFRHSSFLAGMPVAASGELWVKNGALVALSDSSGHYSGGIVFTQQLRSLLKENGIAENSYALHLTAKKMFWRSEAAAQMDHGISSNRLKPYSIPEQGSQLFSLVENMSRLRDQRDREAYFSEFDQLLSTEAKEIFQNPSLAAHLMETYLSRFRWERGDNLELMNLPRFKDQANELLSMTRGALVGADENDYAYASLRASSLLLEHLVLSKDRYSEFSHFIATNRNLGESERIYDLLSSVETNLFHRWPQKQIIESSEERLNLLKWLAQEQTKLGSQFLPEDPKQILANQSRSSFFNTVNSWLFHLSFNADKPETPLLLKNFLATGAREALDGAPAKKAWMSPEAAKSNLAETIQSIEEKKALRDTAKTEQSTVFATLPFGIQISPQNIESAKTVANDCVAAMGRAANTALDTLKGIRWNIWNK